MEFNLYNVQLLLWEVDETKDSEAKVQDKFLLISTHGNPNRNWNNDKFHFDFSRDNTYTKYTTEKVNTKIILFHSDGIGESEFYAKIDYFDYIKLSWRFKKLWIQKKENLMWFTNLIVAILSILFSTYIAIKISGNDKNKSIEINKIQFDSLKKILKENKIIIERIKIDTTSHK